MKINNTVWSNVPNSSTTAPENARVLGQNISQHVFHEFPELFVVTLETSIDHSINRSWDQFRSGSQNETFNARKIMCQVVEYDIFFVRLKLVCELISSSVLYPSLVWQRCDWPQRPWLIRPIPDYTCDPTRQAGTCFRSSSLDTIMASF